MKKILFKLALMVFLSIFVIDKRYVYANRRDESPAPQNRPSSFTLNNEQPALPPLAQDLPGMTPFLYYQDTEDSRILFLNPTSSVRLSIWYFNPNNSSDQDSPLHTITYYRELRSLGCIEIILNSGSAVQVPFDFNTGTQIEDSVEDIDNLSNSFAENASDAPNFDQ